MKGNLFLMSWAKRLTALLLVASVAGLAVAQRATITTQPQMGEGVRVGQFNSKGFFPQVNRTPGMTSDSQQSLNELFPSPTFSLPPTTSVVRANGLGVSNPALVRLNNTAITPGISFPGMSGGVGTWPDANVAVGPDYVVQTVNSQIAFYRKTDGALVFQQSLDSLGFFNQLNLPSSTQPRCFYDQVTQRFFVLSLYTNPVDNTSVMGLAGSQTSDPNGLWNTYLIDTTYRTILARVKYNYSYSTPSFGYNKDYVVTGGLATNPLLGRLGRIIAVNKSDILNGRDRVRIGTFNSGRTAVQMARNIDQGMRGTYGAALLGTSLATFYNVRDVTGQPVLSQITTPSLGFNLSQGFSYFGSLDNFAAGGLANRTGALTDAAIYDGEFVTATTGAVPDGTLGQRSVVHWMHFKMQTWPLVGYPILYEGGDINPISPNESLLPAVSINTLRDITILYHETSLLQPPVLMAVGRKFTDLKGTMGIPYPLATSPDPLLQTGVLTWGTVGMVAVDPNDGFTFWGTHEMLNVDFSWSTQISKYTVSTGGTLYTVYNPASVTPILGTYVSGTAASFNAADGDNYVLSSVTKPQGEYAAYDVNYAIGQSAAQVLRLDFTVQLMVNPGDPTPGYVYFKNQVTGNYDIIRTLRVPIIDSTLFTATVPLNASVYVSAAKTVTVRVTGYQPYRRASIPATPFTLNTDLGQLSVNQNNTLGN